MFYAAALVFQFEQVHTWKEDSQTSGQKHCRSYGEGSRRDGTYN